MERDDIHKRVGVYPAKRENVEKLAKYIEKLKQEGILRNE